MTDQLSLGLRRPQYPPTPDVLQSALAWSFFQRPSGAAALIFERLAQVGPRTLIISSTRPDSGEYKDAWRDALINNGVMSYGRPDALAVSQAVAGSIRGIEPVKGAGVPAAPIGPACALLTDASGAMATANPPNFAQLINQLFRLGVSVEEPDSSLASEMWYHALTRSASRGALSAIDRSVFEAVIQRLIPSAGRVADWPPRDVIPNDTTLPDNVPNWWKSADFDPSQTPFGWFRVAWSRLCSPDWVDVLPPRRWCDWASCVLRQAIAFGFLWEAHFYRTMARVVLGGESLLEDGSDPFAILSGRPLIEWGTTGSISARDVKPRIRAQLRTGLACREVFSDAEWKFDSRRSSSLADVVRHIKARARGPFIQDLRTALHDGPKPPGLKNLIETVEYSLLCRRDIGSSADYYGLTRTVSRRFTHIAPAPEWLVVIASLSATAPRQTCRLADVLISLRALGLGVRIDTVTAELERVGMCAGAPDADEGLLVSPAFGG